ncbi:MAG: glycosyltransferase family 2 protein [Nanoarchaeota archaeon]|nr:glycosyltransferase family 2 protein [Nanoarchaeota archaeon]
MVKIKENLPKVSFVVCTYNCVDFTKRCLGSIRAQDYPQDKVEIVVVDSDSDDGTIEAARELGARVIITKKKGYMEGKGMPKSMGCSKASGDIIITIDSDNKLIEKDWIRKMIYPLLVDKDVNFCICRMAVVHSDPLINQYLSFVGTDPFAVYTSLDPQISLRNVKLVDKGKYYTYNIKAEDFLICGGYYLTFRKETLKKIGGYSRDVDTIYTLAKKNMANVAIPKDAHLHHLMTPDTRNFLKKKVKWGKYYFTAGNNEREFKWASGMFGKFGRIRFCYEVLRSLLFFSAFFASLRMFYLDREKAWLLHGPMTFATTVAYMIAYIKTR